MAIEDRRDNMDLAELIEELHLAHPEEVAKFEHDHLDAMEAVENNDPSYCDPEELDDLREDLVARLRV